MLVKYAIGTEKIQHYRRIGVTDEAVTNEFNCT